MIGLISSSVEVGYYESADKLKAIPIMFVTALGTVALPRISYLNARAEESEIERVFSNSVTLIDFVMTSICFGMMAVCSEFVPVFFGEGFERSINILYLFYRNRKYYENAVFDTQKERQHIYSIYFYRRRFKSGYEYFYDTEIRRRGRFNRDSIYGNCCVRLSGD